MRVEDVILFLLYYLISLAYIKLSRIQLCYFKVAS